MKSYERKGKIRPITLLEVGELVGDMKSYVEHKNELINVVSGRGLMQHVLNEIKEVIKEH